MTLDRVIALILRYFTEFDSSAGRSRHRVKDGPTMSAKYRLPVTFGQNRPSQQSHGLFATAKLLVTFNCRLLVHCSADAHVQNDRRCSRFLLLPWTVA